MKAYNLYKIDPPKIPPGNDFKKPNISINQNGNVQPVKKVPEQNPIPSKINEGSKPFPWGKVCVLGLVLVGAYLFLKIPPNDNYRRRRR